MATSIKHHNILYLAEVGRTVDRTLWAAEVYMYQISFTTRVVIINYTSISTGYYSRKKMAIALTAIHFAVSPASPTFIFTLTSGIILV